MYVCVYSSFMEEIKKYLSIYIYSHSNKTCAYNYFLVGFNCVKSFVDRTVVTKTVRAVK